MLRTSASQVARRVAIPNARTALSSFSRQIARPGQQQIRLKTTETGKKILEANNEIQRDWNATVIAYNDLKPKTQSPNPDTYLIDVREPDEVAQGMIPSAVNVPLSVLANSLQLSPEAFQTAHGFTKPKKTQEVTFYCRSGVRSTSASDVAKRNGYQNILNYKGSWLEWVEKEGRK